MNGRNIEVIIRESMIINQKLSIETICFVRDAGYN